MENLNQLVEEGLAAVEAAQDEAALDQIRVQYLGKKACCRSCRIARLI